MNRFRTSLVLSLLVLVGCGGNADTQTLRAIEIPEDGGVGGTENVPFGGSGGSTGEPDAGGQSGAGTGGADQGGTGGSDVNQGGAGGTDAGVGGSDVGQGGSETGEGGADQGGAGGSDVGQGGADVGQGGSDQGGTGGTDQGTGGSDVGQGGSDGQPPSCDYQGGTCDGLFFQECDGGEYFEYYCDYNCEDNRGCFGECTNGDTRCSGDAAQTCVDGEWTTSEECAFQCVDGACAGACTPGEVVCDGLSTVTCGEDFHFGNAVACPTDPNGTTTCNDGECDLQPIACSAGTADCDGNWSCESDLSSVATCGSCDTACDANPANAAPTCTVSGCGFTCDAGFEDCDGDPANGCELDTRADPLNCGACGNSCYGTTCAASQCEFEFEVVSDYSGENTLVLDMTLTATHIYWLTQTELRRAPKAGGDYETLATLSSHPSVLPNKAGLLVASGKVAWATFDGVYVMPAAGGTPMRIFQTTQSTSVRGLVTANGKLYWNDSQVEANANCQVQFPTDQSGFLLCNGGHTTTFRSYDLTAGGITTLQLSDPEYSTPLGVVGNELYVATYDAVWTGIPTYDIRLNAYNLTTGEFLRQFGGAVTVSGTSRFARNVFSGASMTADTMVYGSNLGIVTAPLSGSNPLATNTFLQLETSTEFVADASTVYYRRAAGNPSSSVQAVSLTGQALAPIFENETNDLLQLAVDNSYIYFTAYTTDGEQAILRAPK